MEDAPRIGRKQSNFSLDPPSASSSRSSSPAPSELSDSLTNGTSVSYSLGYDPSPLSKEGVVFIDDVTPGRKPMDVYDTTLPWWRAAIRKWLVERVKAESETIAKMQERIRLPFLDAYFVYTSSLGTHTFFMILLPAFFFFGYDEIGSGLLMVLALGVYFSSVIKDLICSPRPFAPPVTRLTIGSHHLEYGFPSTHSTNSVSIALFFFSIIHEQTSISPELFLLLSSLLAIYTFSIVFGRLYTAMHSFTDCAMGVSLGTLLWWVLTSWSGIPVVFSSANPLYYLLSILPVGKMTANGLVIHFGQGLGLTARLHSWVESTGWPVPVILVPICLLLVNQHPQPVDDCPCFEDAIAFMSVVFGVLLARWAVGTSGSGLDIVMPGSGWILAAGEWTRLDRGWEDVFLWWAVAAAKMVIGILSIFVWRIVAKSTLHLVLPPIFRLLAKIFDLPNRRFYTPATEYKSVPSEFNTPNGFGLHPIPSVIDLPGSVGVGIEVGGIGSGVDGVELRGGKGREVKMRSVGGGEKERERKVDFEVVTSSNEPVREDKNGRPVKHYDADVLTKVAVYAGIGVIASELMPMMFDYIGLGTKSWI